MMKILIRIHTPKYCASVHHTLFTLLFLDMHNADLSRWAPGESQGTSSLSWFTHFVGKGKLIYSLHLYHQLATNPDIFSIMSMMKILICSHTPKYCASVHHTPFFHFSFWMRTKRTYLDGPQVKAKELAPCPGSPILLEKANSSILYICTISLLLILIYFQSCQ